MNKTSEVQRFTPRVTRRNFVQTATSLGISSSLTSFSALAQIHGNKPVNLSEVLTQFATGLRFEALSEDVVHLAKLALLDTIGCAFGAFSARPSKIAIELAEQVTARRPATVLLRGSKSSPDLATFANGVMFRYLDFNDAYVSRTGGAGHPSDMIAALLSAAEINGRSGRDLILGIVLSYEVFCKIGDVFDYLGNGIDHTTITGMGAVVGAGLLMGLSREQMLYAIGITVGGNTATRQGRSDSLSNWKAYAAADACRKAIFATELVTRGMTGPTTIFEGSYGYFKVMGRKPVEPVQLGEPLGIHRTFKKRFPLGQFAQTVAQAAIEARAFAMAPENVKEINISLSRSAIKIMADGPDKWRPETSETADHSVPYAAGLVLMYGKIEPEYYQDRYLHDAKLLDLVSRIKVQPTEEAEQPDLNNLCLLEVVLMNGARKTYRVEYHRGHFKNPMTDFEVEQKFRQMAQRHLQAAQVDQLLELIRDIDKQPKVDDLIAATKV
ncbi:MAG TPA: MmgE/PrpD family protein [Pseudolabrys sp.]|nr:MmgE/PrpD family protein [Pseudolabrys sp.]